MITEALLLAALLKLLRGLIRDVLEALGATDAGWQAITVTWSLELRWTADVDTFARTYPQASDITVGRLRAALGDLAGELEQVAVAGGDVEAIRRRVGTFRDRWEGWARKVAVTESTRIASEAILASPQALRPGAMKQWVTSHDDRVRATHRQVDGETVPIGGVWMVGGWPMRYPGDPYGQPEEVIGCRCSVRIVQQEGHRGA